MKIDGYERAGKARNFFLQGYNCCQSVAMAFSDVLGMEEAKVAELTSGFGGGFARMREVCGCVSGMTLVCGALKSAADPSDKNARSDNYALVQGLAEEFRNRQGSIVCRELLGIRQSSPDSPVPSDRTPQYYHSRKCADFVACAAALLVEKMQENRAD